MPRLQWLEKHLRLLTRPPPPVLRLSAPCFVYRIFCSCSSFNHYICHLMAYFRIHMAEKKQMHVYICWLQKIGLLWIMPYRRMWWMQFTVHVEFVRKRITKVNSLRVFLMLPTSASLIEQSLMDWLIITLKFNSKYPTKCTNGWADSLVDEMGRLSCFFSERILMLDICVRVCAR